jgi:predicted nucleic acid-binding protein
MILLDTNYLINLLVPGSKEAELITAWYPENDLCTSAIAWYEFLCGPVDDESITLVRSLLRDRILPFTADQASESARLYNLVNRQRRLRVDAMIAAAAIITNAELATANVQDFAAFKPFGLTVRA